jgi:hypothetical protein
VRRLDPRIENTQSEIPRSALDRTVQGPAPSKVTSYPRKRGSNFPDAEVDPRFRGGDECNDFHHYGWAAGPCTLGMTAWRGSSAAYKARRCGRYRPVLSNSVGKPKGLQFVLQRSKKKTC